MPETTPAIRTFIAIHLTDEVRRRLAQFQDHLREIVPSESVRWTRMDQVHLTLRFLGQVPEGQVPHVEAAVRRACASTSVFALRALGAGCFPELRRPRIVWAGLGGALEALAALHQAVERETAAWGEREDRPFHPHLTLGRVKQPTPQLARVLARAVEQATGADFGQWPVRAVALMRSNLTSEGPHYELLAQVPLLAAEAAT